MDQIISKFQQDLLNRLKTCIGSKKLNLELEELLSISSNSAYKKMNGISPLSLEEIFIITQKYQLSVDEFFYSRTSPIPFFSDAIRKMPEHPRDYMLNLTKYMSQLSQSAEMTYITLAGEVPIFHFMPFKELFAFKLYAWNFTNWSVKEFEKKFELKKFLSDEQLQSTINKCAHTFYHFSGIEIWNIRMLDFTVDQIKYFIQLQAFQTKDHAKTVTNQLFDLLDHLENICISGTKRFETKEELNKSSVKIYMDEIMHSNEIIYVNTNTMDHIFTSIDSPNFIRTSDRRYANYIKEWLMKSISHSSQISGEGMKERTIMIEKMRTKLQRAHDEILMNLDIVYGK
ncbi:MAG: helix-turn-helix domain-containing protein [Saprospiraceae bacterium]